jgi:hypothetical protein
MGKSSYSPRQKARRRSAWFSMKRLMSNLDFLKCKRQQQKEHKENSGGGDE